MINQNRSTYAHLESEGLEQELDEQAVGAGVVEVESLVLIFEVLLDLLSQAGLEVGVGQRVALLVGLALLL